MFKWIKSLFSRKCRLCNEDFFNLIPQKIIFKSSDGTYSKINICNVCKNTLQTIKVKDLK